MVSAELRAVDIIYDAVHRVVPASGEGATIRGTVSSWAWIRFRSQVTST